MAAKEQLGANTPAEVEPSHEIEDQTQEIVGVFDFNKDMSLANREIRYKETPAMIKSIESGPGRESIAGHMWGVTILWRNLQVTCPALAEAVDAERVTEMLSMHDMGEIKAGDVSRHLIAQGIAQDKHLAEREGLNFHLAKLPPAAKDHYLALFDEFENTDATTRTLEADVAKMIDALHGDMHYFNYAEMNSADIVATKLINSKLTKPTFRNLLTFFEGTGNQAAFDDVMSIIQAYCDFLNNHDNPGVKDMQIQPVELAAE